MEIACICKLYILRFNYCDVEKGNAEDVEKNGLTSVPCTLENYYWYRIDESRR